MVDAKHVCHFQQKMQNLTQILPNDYDQYWQKSDKEDNHRKDKDQLGEPVNTKAGVFFDNVQTGLDPLISFFTKI